MATAAGRPAAGAELATEHDDHDGPHSYPLPPSDDAPAAVVFDSTVVLTAVPTGSIGVSYGDTFKLHSLPASTYKVYLDFDGHTTTGTNWNSYWGVNSFYSPAFSMDGSESFNATELTRIQQIWQRIAEAFSPFNIDVTTEDPGVSAITYSGTGDTTHGIRVVITAETGKNYGGIAYTGSFNYSIDTPVFVYSSNLGNNVHNTAVAAIHEIGHSLGLSHDGQGSNAYYYGHGSGTTSWAPVMGVGYGDTVVQWSKGEYAGATNTQDDLAIITTNNNGVTWRADEAGNSLGAASALTFSLADGIASVSTYGIVAGSGARNDVDVYWMNVADGGSVNLTVSAAARTHVTGSFTPIDSASAFSMLDVKLDLFDAKGGLVASFDDPSRLDGVMNVSGLAGGTYYLAIDGTGWGDPMAATPTGWTEYGSLGQYMIKGSYSYGGGAPPTPPQLQIDRSGLTTREGGAADSVVVKALNAVGDVLVTIGGLDATEGRLSASTLLLNAANDWTATLVVTGVDDRDVDGRQGYTLTFSADGVGPLSLGVGNLDNDLAPVSAGSAVEMTATKKGGTTKIASSGASVGNIATDNGTGMRITEGNVGSGNYVEWRWQFTGLPGGDQKVQIDAGSTGEAFRFEYSTDGAVTWKAFQGAPASAAAWAGDYLASGAGSTLWVRLVDAVRAGDGTRDSFTIDLLTVAPAAASLAAPSAIEADQLWA